MFKAKKPESYSIEAATAELDGIIAKAEAAHVDSYRLVDALESRAANLRARQAATYSSVPRIVSGNLPA
jgi:hypothetical protein